MSTLEGAPIAKGATQDFWIKGGRGRPYQKTRIESLPDDVLLLIFSCYTDRAQDEERWSGDRTDDWHALVHVCRRWRCVVFASPRLLRLRLLYTMRRSAEEMNDIWPALPIVIVIRASNYYQEWVEEHTPNIITALNHNDRVSEVSFFDVPDEILEIFAAVMKKPFPLLTSLRISSWQATQMVLPDSFLGGSAPRLRSLHLDYVKFPAVWTLLSSSSDLRKLSLRLILGSMHISPDSILSCLSATTRLTTLDLDFGIALSHSDRQRPTRIVLPALTHLTWNGISGYLDNLLAWIDAPQLYSMKTTFGLAFLPVAPHISQFIGRTERFKEPKRANITIRYRSAELMFPLRTQTVPYPSLNLVVNYHRPLWPLSYLVQTCRSSFLPLSTVERLDIDGVRWQSPTENTEWLEVLDFFVAVKDLCVSENVALHVVQALQELSVERATEVLPALRNLAIEGLEPSGPIQGAVEQFVATRHLAGHPVAVRPWTPFKVGPENLGRSTVVETSL
ncbi:hypothetical protein BC826DRAFT_968906 [Russula brevipes]|nr:hypothetical protein BC826DRAFT_968906 [Russula brevipes]